MFSGSPPKERNCGASLGGGTVPPEVVGRRTASSSKEKVAVRDTRRVTFLGSPALPDGARRVREGRSYHAFRAGRSSILAWARDGRYRMWIARVPEARLAELVFAGD